MSPSSSPSSSNCGSSTSTSTSPGQTSCHPDVHCACATGKTAATEEPSLELSNDNFKQIFFSTGRERFEGLAPQVLSRYAEFGHAFLEASCDVITEVLRMLTELCQQYEGNVFYGWL